MNVPPECDVGKEFDGGMKVHCAGTLWRIINKTDNKQYTACHQHIRTVVKEGCTYSIFPARDYSKHANGHDLTADNSRSDHGGINGA